MDPPARARPGPAAPPLGADGLLLPETPADPDGQARKSCTVSSYPVRGDMAAGGSEAGPAPAETRR